MSDEPIPLEQEALVELPVFPLPQVVLFPGARLPLHIFEPRYRAMLRDCLETHRAMAITSLVDGPRDLEGASERHHLAGVGGVGVVVEHEALPDGRSNILLLGYARVTLQELPFRPPYRRARAVILEDIDVHVPAHETAALVSAALAFTAEVKKHDATFELRLPTNGPPGLALESPGALADAFAHQLVIDPGIRMAILRSCDPRERVNLALDALARQAGALGRSPGAVLN